MYAICKVHDRPALMTVLRRSPNNRDRQPHAPEPKCAYVANPRKEHRARNARAALIAPTWLQIPPAPQRSSRKARHRAAWTAHSDFCPWLLLAFTRLQDRQTTKDAPGVLDTETRTECRARPSRRTAASRGRVARHYCMAVRDLQTGRSRPPTDRSARLYGDDKSDRHCIDRCVSYSH